MRRSRIGLGALIALTLLLPASGASASGLYVALGDSTAVGFNATDFATRGYVPLFGRYLGDPAHGGVDDVRNRSRFGESSTTARTEQLHEAIDDIDGPTDTKVVTVEIGINDRWFDCPDGFNTPSCPYASNLSAILDGLQGALDRDPGDEELLVLEYFNPILGTDPVAQRWWDDRLLGSDGVVDCAATGPMLGYNDLTACIAVRKGAVPIDPYPLFKAQGNSDLDGQTHPSDAGHAALAALLENPASSGVAPPAAFLAPSVSSVSAVNLGGRAAGVAASINANGQETTWFAEYGTTSRYGQRTTRQRLGPESIDQPASATLRGLAPGTTYHYRLVAANAVGTANGADQTVTTAGRPVPAVRGLEIGPGARVRGRTLRVGWASDPPAASTTQTLTGVAAAGGSTAHASRVLLGSGRTQVPAGKRRQLVVRLTGAALAQLRRGGVGAVTLTVRATGGDGASGVVRRRIAVRAGRG